MVYGYSNPSEWGNIPSTRGSVTESEPCLGSNSLGDGSELLCRSPRSVRSSSCVAFPESFNISSLPKEKESAWKKISGCFNKCCCCCAIPGSDKDLIKNMFLDEVIDIKVLWGTKDGRKAIQELMLQQLAFENCLILDRIRAYNKMLKRNKAEIEKIIEEHNAIISDFILNRVINISGDIFLQPIPAGKVVTKEDMKGKFAIIEAAIFQELSNNFNNSAQYKALKKKYCKN